MKAILSTLSDFTKEIDIKEKCDIIEIDLCSKQINCYYHSHSWNSNDKSVQRFFYSEKKNGVPHYEEEGSNSTHVKGSMTTHVIGTGVLSLFQEK